MNMTRRMMATLAALAGAVIIGANRAPAADLGGNCCADLEERIAELEATVARKGNRKISVTVSGQINKALIWVDGGDDHVTSVGENSNAESEVVVSGNATITKDWQAGYVLSIGVGGYDGSLRDEIGYGPAFGGDTNDLYTRRSFVYISSPLGKLSLGKLSQATDGIAEISVANTVVVSRMLTLRPLTGPEIGDVLDLWDGTRGNVVRYDTPEIMKGLTLSTSWAEGRDGEDVIDVAARFVTEAEGFKFAAGAGYRRGLIIPTIAALGGDDLEVFSASASVMHLQSGLFLNAAYGDLQADDESLKAWHVQGGVERKLNTLGATTLFVEYADVNDLGLKSWGGGVVQSVDAAALDLYLSVKRFELDGTPVIEDDVAVDTDAATVVMGGARIRF